MFVNVPVMRTVSKNAPLGFPEKWVLHANFKKSLPEHCMKTAI